MRLARDEATINRQTVTRIDHLEGPVSDLIREELVPRISEMHRISTATDPVQFLYFNRLQMGRVCSCWSEADSEADKACLICYGEGYVTGFKKFGCIWECLDVTATSNTVNLAPNYDAQTRPVAYTLTNNAYRGWIDWKVQLQPNVGKLDMMKLGASQPKGSRIEIFIRTSEEEEFTPVTGRAQVESRLMADGKPTVLHFQVRLTRSPKARSPTFSFFHLRYRTREDLTVTVDVPRTNESITLNDMGLYDSWQVLQMVFGAKLRNLGTRDFFVMVRDGTRWKLTELTPFKPTGHLVGYDGSARRVQDFEPYSSVP